MEGAPRGRPAEQTSSKPAGPTPLDEAPWRAGLERRQRLTVEHLALEDGRSERRVFRTQPTTKYHGQVPAFLAEVRSRITSGEHVLISAGSPGAVERLAELCREYDVPYRLGKLEQSTLGSRLAEEGTSATAGAVVLVQAPLQKAFRCRRRGWCFTAQLTCSKHCPRRRGKGQRRRVSIATFRI